MSANVAEEICEPVLMNDVAFLHPVQIGSIVEFNAQVNQSRILLSIKAGVCLVCSARSEVNVSIGISMPSAFGGLHRK